VSKHSGAGSVQEMFFFLFSSLSSGFSFPFREVSKYGVVSPAGAALCIPDPALIADCIDLMFEEKLILMY
jgi:hypothetical protein